MKPTKKPVEYCIQQKAEQAKHGDQMILDVFILCKEK